MEKIALFGGSFNPPHLGHRQVLEYLSTLPEFKEVWVVPAYDHPFEKNLVPFADRLKMCVLMAEGLPVQISEIEKELGQKPSYMIDTIRALKKKNPKVNFSLLLGSDIKPELAQWKDIDQIKKEAELFFIPRAGFEKSPFLNISSTEIRKLIREGKSVKEYLFPSVLKFIEKKGLYR